METKTLNNRFLTYRQIAEIQEVTNEKADPLNSNWREARTKKDFLLAAVLECAELIESAPWKWWKGGEVDHWN